MMMTAYAPYLLLWMWRIFLSFHLGLWVWFVIHFASYTRASYTWMQWLPPGVRKRVSWVASIITRIYLFIRPYFTYDHRTSYLHLFQIQRIAWYTAKGVCVGIKKEDQCRVWLASQPIQDNNTWDLQPLMWRHQHQKSAFFVVQYHVSTPTPTTTTTPNHLYIAWYPTAMSLSLPPNRWQFPPLESDQYPIPKSLNPTPTRHTHTHKSSIVIHAPHDSLATTVSSLPKIWVRLRDSDFVLWKQCQANSTYRENGHPAHQWSARRLRLAFPFSFGGSALLTESLALQCQGTTDPSSVTPHVISELDRDIDGANDEDHQQEDRNRQSEHVARE